MARATVSRFSASIFCRAKSWRAVRKAATDSLSVAFVRSSSPFDSARLRVYETCPKSWYVSQAIMTIETPTHTNANGLPCVTIHAPAAAHTTPTAAVAITR